jgi:putative colanic acid biosynthesis UDP-glucose lipid carrier transferase
MSGQGLIRSHQGSFGLGYRIIDILFIVIGLSVATKAYGIELGLLYISAMSIASLGFILFAESMGVYRSWRTDSVLRMVLVTSGSWVGVCMLILLVGFFAKISESFSRVALGSWMLATALLLCAWRLLFRQILNAMRAKGYNSRRAAIIGLNECGLKLKAQLQQHPEFGIAFDGFYDDRCPHRIAEDFSDDEIKGTLEDLLAKTRSGEYDILFIALPLKAQERIAHILEECGDTTASIHIIPDFFTYNLLHARMGSVGNMQTVSVYETPILGFNDTLKRLFDISFSLAVLAFIAIPMLLIAAAVKLTSPGPIIFKQIRYGLDGKKIRVWKFRSMMAMDNGDKVVQAKKGDARITPVGAFIRKTSLDELPQFINVLQGRMSVVGPRPHAVAHNEEYRKLISYYMLRHKVKPGITGWAQINGFRGETDTLDKMEGRVDHDLEYIRNWSLWMDIRIVFLTVFKGFVGSHVH